MNPPVARKRRKRQTDVKPLNQLHYPYIVAVLIGLAQAQRRDRISADGNRDDTTLTEADAEPYEGTLRKTSGFEVQFPFSFPGFCLSREINFC